MKQTIKWKSMPHPQELSLFLEERSPNARNYIVSILGKRVYLSSFVGVYMQVSEMKGSWGKRRRYAERQFFRMREKGWIQGIIDPELIKRCMKIINSL